MNQKNIPKPANTDKRDFLVQIFDGTWQLQQLTCDTPQTTTCIAVPDGATHAVGSIVVFVDETKPDRLMTVFKVQGDGVLLDGNRNFALNHLVRLATEMERQAQKRLPSNAHILQDIEKREFELGLAPDSAYVKSGSDEQLHLDRALKAQGEVA